MHFQSVRFSLNHHLCYSQEASLQSKGAYKKVHVTICTVSVTVIIIDIDDLLNGLYVDIALLCFLIILMLDSPYLHALHS